jgi:hypothetical protein
LTFYRRINGSYGYTKNYFENTSGVSEDNNYYLNYSIATDILCQLKKSIVIPYIGFGVSGAMSTSSSLALNDKWAKTYTYSIYIPIGFDIRIIDSLLIGLQSKLNNSLMYSDSLNSWVFNTSIGTPTVILSVMY